MSALENKKTRDTTSIDASRAAHFGWTAILFNCDCHVFDYVVATLMRIAGLSYADAMDVADTADRTGESLVVRGSQAHCRLVVSGLRATGLKAAIRAVQNS